MSHSYETRWRSLKSEVGISDGEGTSNKKRGSPQSSDPDDSKSGPTSSTLRPVGSSFFVKGKPYTKKIMYVGTVYSKRKRYKVAGFKTTDKKKHEGDLGKSLKASKKDLFPFTQCAEIQRKILNYRTSDKIGLFRHVRFDPDQVTISYVSSDTSLSNDALLRDVLEYLGLPEHQVKLVRLDKAQPAHLTTACTGGYGVVPERSTIGAFVSLDFQGRNCSCNRKNYILTCGHDKMEGTPYRYLPEDFATRAEQKWFKLQELGTVKYCICRESEINAESMDSALIELSSSIDIKPYVIGQYAHPTDGMQTVRIYLDGFIPLEDYTNLDTRKLFQSKEIQTFNDNPREGIIQSFFASDFHDPFIRPIFNAMLITTVDGQAIHQAGRSGMLVTTRTAYPILPHDFGDGTRYYTGVKIVGILLRTWNRDGNPNNDGYSLALRIDKTFAQLQNYVAAKEGSLPEIVIKTF